MALLTLENKYIKLESNGNFEIYASLNDRLKVKQSTSYAKVLKMYTTIIEKLEADLEFKYYDPLSFAQKYNSWTEEYSRYRYNLNLHVVGQDYPLMAEYYPDVSYSIPHIIESGSIDICEDSASEIYNKAKQRKYWGNTLDV